MKEPAEMSPAAEEQAIRGLLALRRPAYGLALRILGEAGRAEDAVQQAYLDALGWLRRGEPPENERAWFLKVVASAARKQRRGEASRARREAAVIASHDSEVSADVRPEQLAALRREMAALEEKYRLPVALCYEQGLSQREAAEVLELPESTMSKYLQEGLARLRKALERSGWAAVPAVVIAGLEQTAPEVPAALSVALEKLVSSGAVVKGAASTGAGAVLKGGLIVKIGLGIATVGLAAGATFLAVGGKAEDKPAPATPAAAKVAGQDYPYGADALYKREVLFGSFARGLQDGPGPQTELFDAPATRAPNGDWYILDCTDAVTIMKYDAKKGRTQRIGWGGPYGKRGGLLECAHFGGGAYMAGMGLSVDPAGKYLNIHDGNNKGMLWRMSFETMIVEPSEAANSVKDATVSAKARDGSMYFAAADGKLKKLLPDGKTVQDLGVTLEQPCFGGIVNAAAVSEKMQRLYAMNREHFFSPWGVCWYWDLKTGKAVPVAGYKDYQHKGEKPDPQYNRSSGPADKVGFWCASGVSLGPDQGERYVYIGGGDESTFSIVDLEKNYLFKFVKKGGGLWGFGEGRQGKDYNFADPYCWAGSPGWGSEGEFYMGWALTCRMDVWRPVKK